MTIKRKLGKGQKKVYDLLIENPKEKFSIAEIAEKTGLTERRAREVCKSLEGKGIGGYTKKVRLIQGYTLHPTLTE